MPSARKLIAILALAACAPRAQLSPLSPDDAKTAVAQAQQRFSQQPTPEARLALGESQYRAGDDAGARATLKPLLEDTGEIGARASLYDAAAADRMGDLVAARGGYARYLRVHDDAGVRARLAEVARKEADAAARAAIAGEQQIAAGSLPAKSVGVAPLYVSAADTSLAPLGYGLADLLITDLSRSAQIQVVDRVQVDALLRELQLAQSGRVDSTTAPRVGRLIGARRIVNGAIGDVPGGIVVSTRIADAAAGTLVGKPVSERTKLSDILDAEKSLAFALFDELGVTLTPAERAAVEQRPTRYLSAFLAYSRGTREEALGHYTAARAYYARAVMIDPGFQLAASHLVAVQQASDLPGAATSLGAAAPSLITPGSVIDALNPSPAGTLGTIRDRGDASQRATIESGTPGSVTVPVFIP